MKYDKIIVSSQERSREKIAIAKYEIQQMLERKERVTVAALCRYTGFSNSFFYRNPEMRAVIADAQLNQGECYNPKKAIFDQVLEEQIDCFKEQIQKFKQDNKKLRDRNELLETEVERLREENSYLKIKLNLK